MFGALALRDIGYHFPDNNELYKNADSCELLAQAGEIIKNNNYKIINIDSNIICQKPKLSPYIESMREKIANILNLDVNQVSIKAKTNEQMDSVGESLAISANAVVLLDELNPR